MKVIIFCLLLLFTMVVVSKSAGQTNPKSAIIDNFNQAVGTLVPEWADDKGLWFRLRDSLIADPPTYVKSMDRIAIESELIVLHEKRIIALRKMLEAEKR